MFLYYYNILPIIGNNDFSLKNKRYIDSSIQNFFNLVPCGDEKYEMKYTDEGKSKYKDSILGNNNKLPNDALKKAVDEICQMKWYIKIDKNGMMKMWVEADNNKEWTKHKRMIYDKFTGTYSQFKTSIHNHLFSNLEEGISMSVESDMEIEENSEKERKIHNRMYEKYIKMRGMVLDNHVAKIYAHKEDILKELISKKNLKTLLVLFYAAKMHGKIFKLISNSKGVLWTQMYLETIFERYLNHEISKTHESDMLNSWISKLYDAQNSIKFAYQAFALSFVVAFNLNGGVKYIINFIDNLLKNPFQISIPNDSFLFLWIVLSLFISFIIFYYFIIKKEIKNIFAIINIEH
ncbi:MAG: hypothetical protein CVT89_03735 [Candidatus Altiarchaeales archaeon HGW-Altiarchaeales-2]|nr:MAG: hypothetical protein CVT89_03735 [Candidatus Altiarchaeales archaeon HGW-Altiarchaeales-2]